MDDYMFITTQDRLIENISNAYEALITTNALETHLDLTDLNATVGTLIDTFSARHRSIIEHFVAGTVYPRTEDAVIRGGAPYFAAYIAREVHTAEQTKNVLDLFHVLTSLRSYVHSLSCSASHYDQYTKVFVN